jgi:hypothetical protein
MLGFVVVDDEGFVAFFKQLLNATGWGFSVYDQHRLKWVSRSMRWYVCTGKYKVVGQERFDGLAVLFSWAGKYVRTRSELDISSLQWRK